MKHKQKVVDFEEYTQTKPGSEGAILQKRYLLQQKRAVVEII